MTLKFHPKLHSELLDICSDAGTMENCIEFQEIATLLNTANDFVKDFTKIRFKGGNERYIQEIANRLATHFKRSDFATEDDGKLVVTNCDKIRKIFWYMMLNTERTYTKTFQNDPNLSHCLGTLPKMTPCLLLEVLWATNLDQFILEIVSYAPSWFIVAWFDDILESLRAMEPFSLLERVQKLLKAVLVHLKELCNATMAWETKQKFLENISDFIAALLCHFNTPPGELEKWSQMKKSKYYGFVMYYLLSVTQKGMLMYGGEDEKSKNIELEKFYGIKVDVKDEKSVKQEKNVEEFNHEKTLQEICNMFLNTLENIAMLIDANMYIDWFEIDFPDPRHLNDEYTLQHIISHLAHSLIDLQWSTVTLKHDVFPKLQSIQTPPQSTEEFAKSMNLGPLMEKLDNHKILSAEDAKILLEEFLSRDMIYNNEECLETLNNCRKMLNVGNCSLIIKKIAENDEEEFEDSCKEKLGEILSEVINSMSETEIYEFLKSQNAYFSKPYVNIEFDVDLDDVLYDSDTEILKILKAVAKNPKQFLSMSRDIVTNSQKFHPDIHKRLMEHYVKVLSVIATKVSETLSVFKASLNALMDISDSAAVGFFFSKVYKCSIFAQKDFVKGFLIENIADTTDGQKILNVSQILLKILDNDAVSLAKYLPMLVVAFGFLLDKVRNSLENYGDLASSLLEAVTAVMHRLVKVFLPIATSEQKLFVQLQLKEAHPLTKYYLQKLDLEKGQEQATLERFLHPDGFNAMEKRLLTATFCEYLTKCTRKELTLLTKNHEIRHYFTDAMLIIVVSLSEQTKTLEFALKNYSHLFQMMSNEENIGAQEALALLKGVVKIFCALPEDQKEVTAYGIVPHLKKLVERIVEKDENSKEIVESELAKTNIAVFKPEIIFATK
ncbi:uncharacterized protein LOC134833986 [Culicoides brevitarsis]|uniref:uncharacterized protein LOC134833986 n=1 Tax=Culicoides brevitarsis TaxID=469753 RepID=UPI00307BC94E